MTERLLEDILLSRSDANAVAVALLINLVDATRPGVRDAIADQLESMAGNPDAVTPQPEQFLWLADIIRGT